jgi:hypothetical protein
MERHLVRFLLLIPVSILFLAWFRKPFGRGTTNPGISGLRTLRDFNKTNPEASDDAKESFYQAVLAQQAGNFATARTYYSEVLHLIEDEPNTNYNLSQMK